MEPDEIVPLLVAWRAFVVVVVTLLYLLVVWERPVEPIRIFRRR
jgi:hypothetical protein